MGLTKVLLKDPCPIGLPEMLTLAHRSKTSGQAIKPYNPVFAPCASMKGMLRALSGLMARTWTPNGCKILGLWAVVWGFGPFFCTSFGLQVLVWGLRILARKAPDPDVMLFKQGLDLRLKEACFFVLVWGGVFRVAAFSGLQVYNEYLVWGFKYVHTTISGLQVCKQYLHWGLKHVSMTYFGLFGASGLGNSDSMAMMYNHRLVSIILGAWGPVFYVLCGSRLGLA